MTETEQSPNGTVEPQAPGALMLGREELLWLVGKLEEMTIPSVQGKMIGASIQAKAMNVLQEVGDGS